MSYHASLSPSSAHRWTSCSASINAQAGLPNENSAASMAGTCCHQISAEALQVWIDAGHDPEFDLDAQPYLGRVMRFWKHPETDTNGEDWSEAFEDDLGIVMPPLKRWSDEDLGLDFESYAEFTAEVEVTQEMVDAVNAGIRFVMDRVVLMGGHLEVEQRVPIGHFTGEHGATGTSDVVHIYGDTASSIDFKYGRHKVLAYDIVEPARGSQPPKMRMNLQLAHYILGALQKYADRFPGIKRVKSTIVQPFTNHVSEYECSIEELYEVREYLRGKAEETRTNPVFVPSYDACHFCKARNPADPARRCKARDEHALSLATDGFEETGAVRIASVPAPDQLGRLFAATEFVREWCDDIAVRVRRELEAGRPVVRHDGLRYILVQGRKGDRKWDDPKAVEEMLKHMRLRKEDMYVMKVIGPAVAEKLAPKVTKRKPKADAPEPILNGLQWRKLQQHIVQAEGGFSVALETDSRPEMPGAADGFDEVVGGDADIDLGI